MLFQNFVLLTVSLIASINCDTCDTYKHPQYGLGVCIETTKCTGAYISGLCESKPANVKCCFTSGGSSSSSGVSCSSATQKLSHAEAFSYLKNAGITTYSSGGCSDPTNNKCTSLEKINCKSISELVAYKKASNCQVVVTGGTETGHATGPYSHSTGYKIDISLNTCHDSHIKSNFKYAGLRSDGASLYKDANGNTWALEGNHWDILFP